MSRMFDIALNIELNRVLVTSDVVSYLKRFRQHRRQSREACGILLGYEWDRTSKITHATPPQKTDKRSRHGYIRDITGHVAIATEIWHNSNHKIGYLGEWHTHPESVPNPSAIDVREANIISRRNASPVISLILGKTHGCVFIAFGNRPSHYQQFPI